MTPRTLRSIFRHVMILTAAGSCSPYGLDGNMPLVVVPSQNGTGVVDQSGNLAPAECAAVCNPRADDRYGVRSCHPATRIAAGAADAPRVVCDVFYFSGGSSSFIVNLPSGRAPADLRSAVTSDQASIARYLAEMAHLEAASVISFRRLSRDLDRHAAPRALRRRADAAAHDEARHARAARRLARSHSALIPRVRVGPYVERGIEDVARENVIEGCVRETYAALLAGHQAVTATDPRVRRLMKRISKDEERHAALAWSVHLFALTRLDPSARRRLDEAKAEAERDLHRALAKSAPHESLGLPTPDRALAMARALARALAG
ncbi:hypothetical protein BH09MYX1_BH09MYX1_25610 [soil metagenome]